MTWCKNPNWVIDFDRSDWQKRVPKRCYQLGVTVLTEWECEILVIDNKSAELLGVEEVASILLILGELWEEATNKVY